MEERTNNKVVAPGANIAIIGIRKKQILRQKFIVLSIFSVVHYMS
jgi:hypothetical protein